MTAPIVGKDFKKGDKVLVRLITDGSYGAPFKAGQLRTGFVGSGHLIRVMEDPKELNPVYGLGFWYDCGMEECKVLRRLD
jgi:hypothetical protein